MADSQQIMSTALTTSRAATYGGGVSAVSAWIGSIDLLFGSVSLLVSMAY